MTDMNHWNDWAVTGREWGRLVAGKRAWPWRRRLAWALHIKRGVPEPFMVATSVDRRSGEVRVAAFLAFREGIDWNRAYPGTGKVLVYDDENVVEVQKDGEWQPTTWQELLDGD